MKCGLTVFFPGWDCGPNNLYQVWKRERESMCLCAWQKYQWPYIKNCNYSSIVDVPALMDEKELQLRQASNVLLLRLPPVAPSDFFFFFGAKGLHRNTNGWCPDHVKGNSCVIHADTCCHQYKSGDKDRWVVSLSERVLSIGEHQHLRHVCADDFLGGFLPLRYPRGRI